KRERLLAQDVLAGGQHRQHDLLVFPVGQGDAHEADALVRHRLTPVGDGLAEAVAGGDRLGCLPPNVAHAEEIEARAARPEAWQVPPVVRRVGRPHHSGPDDADAEAQRSPPGALRAAPHARDSAGRSANTASARTADAAADAGLSTPVSSSAVLIPDR